MDLFSSGFLLVQIVFPCLLASTSGHDPRPHIVFVLADDYGYHDVGYHGSEIATPTLDQLAGGGVRLENYYVSPACSPTRSQLMTGRHQIHTGLQHGSIEACQPNAMPDDSPTLADKMKESGYATHMVGKWHLGFYKEKFLPWKRGFDTFYGYYTGAEDHFTHNKTYNEMSYLELHAQDGPVWIERGHYSTHLFTEKAIDVVESHNASSSPLFLYLAYQSVHSPLQVPEIYEDKFKHIQNPQRRTYAGMVAALDEGVGNLTKSLKSKGLWNNTVFVFSTDNGANLAQGGSNFPLRGGKGSYWEGGTRGVGFVSGGGLTARTPVNKQLIHASDWFPTLVRLAQGKLNGTKTLDGVDQWDAISRNLLSRRDAILHNIDPLVPRRGAPLYPDTFDTSVTAALREGEMKILTGTPGDDSWGAWSVLSDTKNVWLFNLTSDPLEQHDLSDVMPDVVKRMLKRLEYFNSTSVTPVYPDPDPKCDPYLHLDIWGPWM